MQICLSNCIGGRKWSVLKPIVLALFAVFPSALRAQATNSTDATTAYTRTINQRADKIVATLGIVDTNAFVQIRDIIAQQYRDLNTIHEARDAQVKVEKAKAGADGTAANAAVQAVRDEFKPRLDKLHGEFLSRLAANLSPGQVDKVKDGMTYGVVHGTYNVYLTMYPDLTSEQKNRIMDWLVEARELAMDGSTSDEKHAVFGKYKGKINNYLSKAGYDARKGEQNLKNASRPPSKAESN